MLDLIQLCNGQLCVPQAGTHGVIVFRAGKLSKSPLHIFSVLTFIVQIGAERVGQLDLLCFKDANQSPLGVDADRLPGKSWHFYGIITFSVVCMSEGAGP